MDGDEKGVVEEEEAEVEKELLLGPFDKCSFSGENVKVEQQNSCNDTFNLEQILLDFYGSDGSKAELVVNVLPPDFRHSGCNDVVSAFEVALASKRSVLAPIEEAPPPIVIGATEHV